MPLLTQLKVPEQIEFKLGVLVNRCLHRTTPSYLADVFHQSSDADAHQRLCSVLCAAVVLNIVLKTYEQPKKLIS